MQYDFSVLMCYRVGLLTSYKCVILTTLYYFDRSKLWKKKREVAFQVLSALFLLRQEVLLDLETFGDFRTWRQKITEAYLFFAT